MAVGDVELDRLLEVCSGGLVWGALERCLWVNQGGVLVVFVAGQWV